MNRKIFCSPIEIKADSEPGEFSAIFSRFNVIDKDGDVTLPGAFKEGAEVRISYWGHRWQDLPVGRGTINSDDQVARVQGRFFLDTQAGKETYLTVKNLGNLAEWSFGYDVLDSELGKHDGKDVRILKSLEVPEVSPVLLGAGIDTRTETIKGMDGMKPYPNEHACRLREPDEFQDNSFRRMQRKHDGKEYSIIIGRLKDDDTTTEQAYRYSKDIWTSRSARTHCESHDGKFEIATGEPKGMKGAIASHSTDTTDAAWDGPANEARAESGRDEAYYKRIYAWRDPDGDVAVKSSYKFIHHMVSADGAPGAANIRGCQTGIGVLNGGRGGTTIPDADRRGVWNHLAKHLRDADLEPPELKSVDDQGQAGDGAPRNPPPSVFEAQVELLRRRTSKHE